ncbi:MAG: 50S ribosomal protein L25 [Candidatus Arsenophonus melophagi]|nr:50S ribosomal protein L25 [Candidatus Arsenophonus melophagi]
MITINATICKKQGTGASRRLRKNNKLPAIIYGGNQKPVSIALNHDEVFIQKNKAEFYKKLTLIVDGIKNTVKVQAIQYHPVKPKLTHIDFLRIE